MLECLKPWGAFLTQTTPVTSCAPLFWWLLSFSLIIFITIDGHPKLGHCGTQPNVPYPPSPMTSFPMSSYSPTYTSPLNPTEAHSLVGKQTALPQACSPASTSTIPARLLGAKTLRNDLFLPPCPNQKIISLWQLLAFYLED